MHSLTTTEDDEISPDVLLDADYERSVPTAVRTASNLLRAEILKVDSPDSFLGSEEELLERLSISRPTFRQVARLLEQEQLLAIKRGPGGGFFTRRPSFEGIVHQASVCLVAHKTVFSDLMTVGRPLLLEIARQAAANPDPAVRHELIEFVDNIPPETDTGDSDFWVKATHEFTKKLLEIAGNPALTMFMHIIQKFAAQQFNAQEWINAEHVARYTVQQRRMAEAVAMGDTEYAGLIASRINDLMDGWGTVEN